MKDRYILAIAVFSISMLATGCGGMEPKGTSLSAVPSQTQTPIPHTFTISPTTTPTLTPTPTSTALPVLITNRLLIHQQSAPTAQPGAPCGVVDTLDFPVDPPDGRNVAYGGQDFGVFRENYRGYHTGEDWWGPRSGGSSFGIPVHSIGHGVVTHAEPNGWGRDQGTIVIRHTFPDGSRILSFYGHLHPPSVTLRIGDCVKRGEQIGKIGRPRSTPHLHFEIREHRPSSTGRGYWSSDPTEFGWKSPSLYIWKYRIRSSPGVQWLWYSDGDFVQRLDLWNRDTLVALRNTGLVGIDIENGTLLWELQISERAITALFDTHLPQIYTINHRRELVTYELNMSESEDLISNSDLPLEPIWKIPLDSFRNPTLIPLPGGGVVVSIGDKLLGVSSVGKVLWQHNPAARPMDWLLVNEQLIMITMGRDDPIWTIDEDGPTVSDLQLSGYLAATQDRVWIYAEDGVYLLNTEPLSAELIYPLPKAILHLGDMIALPDGSLFLTHTDIHDERLILIGPDGELRWQRSFSGAIQGELSLFELEGQLFLVTQDETTLPHQRIGVTSSEIIIYSVDPSSGKLTLMFKGGTRNPNPNVSSILVVGEDQLLINVWGINLVMLNTRAAMEAIAR